MVTVNKVMLMGHLTRDPEIRSTPGGAAVCEFSLALNRSYTKKETGEKIDEVTFVDVTVWNRTAEICGEHLKKGRPVFVEGHLKQDRWEDKGTGQKRSKLCVTAERVTFLGNGKKEGNEAIEAPVGADEEIPS